MSDDKFRDNEISRRTCGCYTITFDNGQEKTHVCLACALTGAGMYLKEAGNRLREQREAELDGPRVGDMPATKLNLDPPEQPS